MEVSRWLSAVADCNSHQNRFRNITTRTTSSNTGGNRENRLKEGCSGVTCQKRTKKQSPELPVFTGVQHRSPLSLSFPLIKALHSLARLERTNTECQVKCGRWRWSAILLRRLLLRRSTLHDAGCTRRLPFQFLAILVPLNNSLFQKGFMKLHISP